MTATVRKNSKEYKAMLTSKIEAVSFSLDTNFEGFSCVVNLADYKRAVLTKHENKYTLSVHSNLWYKWSA